MSSVGVNPPHTPVTEGSGGKALATMPNVCKMPGPPAPFVPTPLPNIGTSGDSLTDGSTTVKFEGSKIAIKGSYFMSQPSGDVASQGTGGGIVSAKTQGKTEWVAPGSMDVKADGKNIQLLGDAVSNNGGSPANAATMKVLQKAIGKKAAKALCAAVCAHYGQNTAPDGSNRQQSKRAEEDFLGSPGGAGWNNQEHINLDGGGACRPDLFHAATDTCVELKDVGENYTSRQLQFQDEIEDGALPTDYKYIKVTPETCGC
jgi:uncharacterized Zn-binding protein involved in type VI secretion